MVAQSICWKYARSTNKWSHVAKHLNIFYSQPDYIKLYLLNYLIFLNIWENDEKLEQLEEMYVCMYTFETS